jgi:hypothetical protein
MEEPAFPKRAEKSPLESKKFIAYLLSEATWKALLIFMILKLGEDGMGPAYGIMLAIVIVAGFLEVGFILGQAYIDKFVRVAEVVARVPSGPSLGPSSPSVPNPPAAPAPASVEDEDDGPEDDGPEDD